MAFVIFLNNDPNPMIWHAFLVCPLLDADQITGSKLCHFKCARPLLSLIGEHSHTFGCMITGLPVMRLLRFT